MLIGFLAPALALLSRAACRLLVAYAIVMSLTDHVLEAPLAFLPSCRMAQRVAFWVSRCICIGLGLDVVHVLLSRFWGGVGFREAETIFHRILRFPDGFL